MRFAEPLKKLKFTRIERLRYSTNDILYAYRILLLRRTSIIALDEDFQSFRVSIHNLIEVSQLLGPDALAVAGSGHKVCSCATRPERWADQRAQRATLRGQAYRQGHEELNGN